MKTLVVVLLSAFFLSLGVAEAAQEAKLAPGDNMIVDGVPQPPISLVDEANKYSESRSALLYSWHPQKREMLIGTRFAETPQIHVVKQAGGARFQLTFFRDKAVGAVYEPTNGNSFVFSKDNGGDEFYQLYKYDVESGAITRLTDGKSRNTSPVWSNKGDLIAYGSTRRNGSDVDIYVVNPLKPNSDHMLTKLSGGGWEVLDWSRDDGKLLVRDEVSVNESYLWLIDTVSGAAELITPKSDKEKIYWGAAKFSNPDVYNAEEKRPGIFAITDKDSDNRRLAWFDLQAKQTHFLTSQIHWNVDDFDLSFDGKKIAFVTNEDGFGVLHLLDAVTGHELPVPSLPKGIISALTWHKNNKDLGFCIESATSPIDAYSITLNDGTNTVERWTKSETGGLNAEEFATPKLIKWPGFDGKEISGFLYRPPAKFSGPRPVLINIHGGPEGQSRPGYLANINYFINELGVAVIYPNVRGSEGYGKNFLTLDNGMLREGSYKDIGALFDWIRGQRDLDASRVMVAGGSYGGFMTLAVATNYDKDIRCALDVVGPSNLVTFLEHTQGYRRDLRRVEYGDERDAQMRAFLEKIAPLNHVDQISKPLFVVQGKNDPRVPASESEQIVEKLHKQGTPVWFMMANDEGHGFAKKKNREYQFYSTIMFIKQFLLN